MTLLYPKCRERHFPGGGSDGIIRESDGAHLSQLFVFLRPKLSMKSQVANDLQAYVMDMRTTSGTPLAYPEDDRIRCVACGHRCLIGEDKRGICKVRFVQNGELRVPWGYVAGLQ